MDLQEPDLNLKIARAKGRHANRVRNFGADDPIARETHRELTLWLLVRDIVTALSAEPELTPAQRNLAVKVLRTGRVPS